MNMNIPSLCYVGVQRMSDDLVYKKYIVHSLHIPKSVHDHINIAYGWNRYEHSMRLAAAEFNGILIPLTWGFEIEFETEAHYTWFIMKWS